MKKAIFGLVKNAEQADRIVNRLQQAGFSNEGISVLLSDKEGKLQKQEGTEGFDAVSERQGALGVEKHSKAPEDGVTGTIAGGLIGGSIGLLAGIGSLAIPGLGILIAAGPILGALSGGAVGGAVGLLIGALVGMGIPEYEAKKYEDALKSGGVLICVLATESKQIDRAKEIFTKEGAKNISTSRETAGTSL